MATISGTITGATNVSKAHMGAGTTSARDGREVWLLTVNFAAYTSGTDDADVVGVGAAISARARDGKTRTLRSALPAAAGADANNQAVYLTGASADALTVSVDNLTGELSNDAGTEITTAGTTVGCAIMVAVSAA